MVTVVPFKSPHSPALSSRTQFGQFSEKQEAILSTFLDYMEPNNPKHRFTVLADCNINDTEGRTLLEKQRAYWVLGSAFKEATLGDSEAVLAKAQEDQISRAVKLQKVTHSGQPKAEPIYMMEKDIPFFFTPLTGLKTHAQSLGIPLNELA